VEPLLSASVTVAWHVIRLQMASRVVLQLGGEARSLLQNVIKDLGLGEDIKAD
jgi:hypothetical protein